MTTNINSAANLLLHTGKRTQVLQAGEKHKIKATQGDHYRLVKRIGDTEHLLDDVVAKRQGDDLLLRYADGTELTLESYYSECKALVACDITLPSDNSLGYKPGTEGSSAAALGDGSSLVYAHGAPDTLMQMAQGQSVLHQELNLLRGDLVTWLPGSERLVMAFPTMGGGLVAAGGGLAVAVSAGGASGSLVDANKDTIAPNAKSVEFADDGDTTNGVQVRVALASDAQAGDTMKADIKRNGIVVQTITLTLTADNLINGVVLNLDAANVAQNGDYSASIQLKDPAGNQGQVLTKELVFTVFNGLVHDDYLANAFVFVDSNRNNRYDEGVTSAAPA